MRPCAAPSAASTAVSDDGPAAIARTIRLDSANAAVGPAAIDAASVRAVDSSSSAGTDAVDHPIAAASSPLSSRPV